MSIHNRSDEPVPIEKGEWLRKRWLGSFVTLKECPLNSGHGEEKMGRWSNQMLKYYLQLSAGAPTIKIM